MRSTTREFAVVHVDPKVSELDVFDWLFDVGDPEPVPEAVLLEFDFSGRHDDLPSLPNVQYNVSPAAVFPDCGPLASHNQPSVIVVVADELFDEFPGEPEFVFGSETFTPFDQTSFFPDLTQVYS